jgi:hypothetical protein
VKFEAESFLTHTRKLVDTDLDISIFPEPDLNAVCIDRPMLPKLIACHDSSSASAPENSF